MSKFTIFGRGLVVAAFLGAGSLSQVRAQEISEAHLAAAKSAIDALAVTTGYNNILPNLAEQLKAQFIQTSPNFEQQISDVINTEALALAPRRADLEKEAATIYARNFTVEELNSIASFFGTEAGKKLMSTEPVINRELLRAAEIWANGISRDLNNQASEKLRTVLDLGAAQGADGAAATPATQPGG